MKGAPIDTAPQGGSPPQPGPSPGRATGYLAFALRHRRFVGFGFALTFFSSFGQTYFLSTFGRPIRAAFDLSAAAWGARYGLATAVAALGLMWLGRRIDDLDLRRWTAQVLLALAGACLLMAWTPNAGWLVLSLFAMRLAGQGLMGHTATTSMARYFEAERGRAITISGLGFALGFSLFPRLGVEMQKWVDWRTAWLILAGAALGVVYPLARSLLRGHAERHAAWLASLSQPASSAPRGEGPGKRHFTRAEVLRDWRFYLLLPGVLACPFLMTGMIFFHDDLAAAKGWTKEYLAGSMVLLGLALYASSIAMGALVDRLGPRRLIALTQIPLALSMLALATIEHPTAALAYLIGAGMTMGSLGPVGGSLWPDLYGTRHLGSIRALVAASMGLSTAAAPWIFGLLLDRGASMQKIAAGSATYVLFGIATLAFAVRSVRPSEG